MEGGWADAPWLRQQQRKCCDDGRRIKRLPRSQTVVIPVLRSEFADNFAAATRTDGPPDIDVDVFRNESDCAVAQQ